jgi:hypothetical protein
VLNYFQQMLCHFRDHYSAQPFAKLLSHSRMSNACAGARVGSAARLGTRDSIGVAHGSIGSVRGPRGHVWRGVTRGHVVHHHR